MFLRNVMSQFFVVKHIPKMMVLLLHNNNACCSLFGQCVGPCIGWDWICYYYLKFITSCLYEPVWKLKKF